MRGFEKRVILKNARFSLTYRMYKSGVKAIVKLYNVCIVYYSFKFTCFKIVPTNCLNGKNRAIKEKCYSS